MSAGKTAAALRAKADEAVKAWREASEVYAARRNTMSPPPRGDFARILKWNIAEQAAVAAAKDRDLAWVAAIEAVEAAEFADGDELAIKAHPSTLRAEFDTIAQEAEQLRQAFAALKAREVETRQRADEAVDALNARRTADNLPTSGYGRELEARFAAANMPTYGDRERVAYFISSEAKATIARLQRGETLVRAELERETQEREREEARLAAFKAERHRPFVTSYQNDETARQERAVEDLAAAHRARTAG